jgi:hypothetical protein
MGLLFRRRRPLIRLAAGAAVAGSAYRMGRKREEQNAYNEQAHEAYSATMETPPSASPSMLAGDGGSDEVAELERLAQLHSSGALTDDEFSAAKASLLGS